MNGRILVTGATGFIGARLVEALVRRGLRVRAVTSDFRHCVRIARFPVEFVKGNLLDPPSLAKAANGCDTIFHLAYRFGGTTAEQRDANVRGTQALAEAAATNGVRRFVHFSSIATYGPPFEGDLTEQTRRRRTNDSYTVTKRSIDDMLREFHARRRLPVTFVQPTIVYGPFGYHWTTRLVQQAASGRVVLPGDGAGLCNAVYVDDVVTGALLASVADRAIGEMFLISAASPVTWRDFFGAYERMARHRAVVLMDHARIREQRERARARTTLLFRLRHALARRAELRDRLLALPPQRWLIRTGEALLPAALQGRIKTRHEQFWKVIPPDDPPLYIPDRPAEDLYASHTRVRIEKARDLLGYEPAFDLERGMAITAAWAQWARLVPPPAQPGDPAEPRAESQLVSEAR